MKNFLIWLGAFAGFFPVIHGMAQNTHQFPAIEYVENQGQWDGPFRYKALTSRGDLYVRNSGFTVVVSDGANREKIHAYKHGESTQVPELKYFAYEMNFLGANPEADFTQSKKEKHFYNYYLGKDPSRWKSKIYPARVVDRKNLYAGIDLHLYSDQGNIKYDYIIHPGANVSRIKLEYKGVTGLSLKNGNLQVQTSLGNHQELKPYAYQYIDGEKREVLCEYVIQDAVVGFETKSKYDARYDLIIDPVLVFCTFTGSTADNWGFTATYDTLGMFYAGGVCAGIGYPTSLGQFTPTVQPNFAGGGFGGNGFQCDASFSKFDATGVNLIFATYLGGSDNDQPQSMIVDGNGNLGVAGRTYSTNFPVSAGAYDNSSNGMGDMFVTVFNSNGTALVGSTYMGGSSDDGVNFNPGYAIYGGVKHNYGDDARTEIIVDPNGNWYVAGCTQSSNFPTFNPYQASNAGGQDAIVFQLNNTCSNLIWSTYLGGSLNDAAYVLSLDKNTQSILYVGGGTESSNFPSTPGVINPAYQGGTVDGYLLKFDANTKALQAGTFIGTGLYDQVYGVQTDDSNHVYICGQTMGAFPITPATVYSNPGSSQFVMKMNNNLASIIFSTVFGSGTTAFTNISPTAFLVDKCENIYVSGWGGPTSGSPGNTNGMPLTPNAIQSTTDGSDFYFIAFNKNAQSLLYGSYFGQNGLAPNGLGGEHVDGGTSRFDPNGVIYQAICANCGGVVGFPTQPTGVFSLSNPSPNCNLAALKIDFQLQNPEAVANFLGDSIGCVPFVVNFNNLSVSATNYIWDFGDGTAPVSQVSPSHTYTTAGNFTVKLIAFNPNGCTSSSDTTTLTIIVRNDSIQAGFNYVKIDSCGPYTANFLNTSTYNGGTPPATSNFFWDFGDGTTYTGATPPQHSFPGQNTYTVTLVMVDTNACKSPDSVKLVIDFNASLVAAEFDMPDTVCLPAFVNFLDQSTNATTWYWNFGDGNTANIANPSNQYVNVGVFDVLLIAGNPATCNKLDTAIHTIHVYPSPVADFSWLPNPPEPNTPLDFTNLSTGATRYLWDFGDGSTSTNKDEVHVYQKDGYYNVCLTAWNEYNCQDTACKQVRGLVIPLVDVPTGFSPNGDGANDIVYVKGYGIAKMTFRIFNRWGEKVFESTDKSYGWDGRYKGVIQEMEVYGYTLSVDFFDGTSTFKKGNITLLK